MSRKTQFGKTPIRSKYAMTISYILLIYLGFGLMLFLLQKSFIYFPVAGPSQHGLQEEFFTSDGENIQVLVVNPGRENALIYFGGNAEAVAYNGLEFSSNLSELSVYLVNYRGYGKSSGSPSEKGLYNDALVIYDRLKNRHGQLSIMGRSLGTGVATYLAAHRETHKLVLVTPFDSIEKIAQGRFPIYPISLLLREKYQSDQRTHLISAPALVLIAEHDHVIPRKSTHRLVNRFDSQQVKVKLIAGADHNNISVYPEYMKWIKQFLFGLPK